MSTGSSGDITEITGTGSTEGSWNVLDYYRMYPEIGQATWVELIIANFVSPRVQIHRELADPSTYVTVQQLALVYGVLSIATHFAYLRSLPSGRLDPLDWDTLLVTKMSILVTNTPAALNRISTSLQHLPEILPRRMVW